MTRQTDFIKNFADHIARERKEGHTEGFQQAIQHMFKAIRPFLPSDAVKAPRKKVAPAKKAARKKAGKIAPKGANREAVRKALTSAGKPLSMSEVVKATGIKSKTSVSHALDQLVNAKEATRSADKKYSMR
jgi:hypothetical protein